MLSTENRMRRPAEFGAVIRNGRRARSGTVVIHHLKSMDIDAPGAAPRVGLVVGKSVGGSVVRHRVSRQLRAQLAQRLDRLPTASGTVVRALAGAADAGSAALGHDLDVAFDRVLTSAGRR